jgi:formate hydrogenlyase subunit 7
VAVEREARRMAGYVYGAQIADKFLELVALDSQQTSQGVHGYVEQQADPRLAEIMSQLERLYQDRRGGT